MVIVAKMKILVAVVEVIGKMMVVVMEIIG